ncbi:MAG: hypothetical protein M3O67_08570 [Bacteroidota bacterium]|nr:hypothetical protein [Bacteroidota bacterium]
MKHLIKNEQQMLAQQFCLADLQVNKASYNGVLIIKRWKLISKIPAPVVGEVVHRHTQQMIQRSFFSFIPNQLLLIEGAFFNRLEN